MKEKTGQLFKAVGKKIKNLMTPARYIVLGFLGVIAVGTTSVRTLETVADENGFLRPCSGDTSIFIYPPYKFKCVDALITNFHLPDSTLIMLVSAFMGREQCLSLYRESVGKWYRFFSFGDAMLIL